jgi:argininosuccinate synthase
MAKDKIKKVVLSYSGGLDTSVIVPWLKNNYDGCEVICFTADLGQNEDLSGLDKKAVASGASKLIVQDLREECRPVRSTSAITCSAPPWPGP